MSTVKLPAHTLNQLDKISRNFLWGSTNEERKLHLLAWDKVCLTRGEGGLGIRQAADMNIAMNAKVGWRILNDKESLWARVLRSKYKIGEVHDLSWTFPKRNSSTMWRSVAMGLREVVYRGLSWVLGDGSTIRFWQDRWLGNSSLQQNFAGELPNQIEHMRVREFWENGQGWDIPMIAPYISEATRLELASVIVDNITGARDRISWGENVDGIFTVKSVYSLLRRDETPRPQMECFYKRIWSVVATERAQMFLWLAAHRVLMTNAERYRRHMSQTDACQVCRGGVETVIHILRDCPAMDGIWRRIVPDRRRHEFFQMDLLEWLFHNLGDNSDISGVPWRTTFAMACWWSWKWRCSNVFGETRLCWDRVKFIKNSAAEVTMAHIACRQFSTRPTRVERMIAWTPPRVGWLKMNTDGASQGNPGRATAGGTLRNGEGDWCYGFALNIGRRSALLAELWGVYYGLCLAWERQVSQLELEVDSEVVVRFLTTGVGDSHPLSFLVRLCHGFLAKNWSVRVTHVYREANRLADGLANYAFSLPLGLHTFDSTPDFVTSLWREDLEGLAFARQVLL